MTNPLAPSTLLTPLISSAAMRRIVSDHARLQRMLDFEAALIRAEAAVGVVPPSAIDPIGAACRAELYDAAVLGVESVAAGNVAIPLVKALTAEVAKASPQAASYVHWGATSQDVIDTALVLELRAAIDALIGDLNRAIEPLTALAGRHRRTPAVARISMQHALPVPFGLKAAGYAAALGRARERLRRVRKDALMLQFGGAAGTLAALGDNGLAVTERLAALLDLPAPEAPWHSHRDRLGEVAASFGILAGTCGKIGRDIALLMQTEVAEAFERSASGDGGASTMQHKRNPTAATAALAAAAIAPQLVATILATEVQEHERALGGWQAEWPTFAALALVTSGALAAVADIAQGLEVDPDRMRSNLDLTHGLIMAEPISFALAAKIGKPEAHKIVEEASRKAAGERKSLQDVLAEDSRVTTHLPIPVLARLFEPNSHQGAAQTFIDRQVGRVGGNKRP